MSEAASFLFDRSIFTVNLLIICVLFLIPLEKRRRFPLRLAAGAALCIALSLLFPHTNLKYIVELAAAGAFVYSVCAVSPQDAAYCAVCAYATQHFAHALYLFLFRADRAPPSSRSPISCAARGPMCSSTFSLPGSCRRTAATMWTSNSPWSPPPWSWSLPYG